MKISLIKGNLPEPPLKAGGLPVKVEGFTHEGGGFQQADENGFSEHTASIRGLIFAASIQRVAQTRDSVQLRRVRAAS